MRTTQRATPAADSFMFDPHAETMPRESLTLLQTNRLKQTLQRAYWSNKATGITADVPSEAMLTPQLWGKWEFVARP